MSSDRPRVGSDTDAAHDSNPAVNRWRRARVAGWGPDHLKARAPGRLGSSGHPCDYTDMSPLDHDHPVNPTALQAARVVVLSRQDAERLSRLLGVLADHVRSRLLFALVSVDELCVGDLAIALGDVNEDQTSYALKALRNAGLVQTRREGRVIN